MSALADLVAPPADVMAAVWRRVNGDAALQTELGGAGRVINGGRASNAGLVPRLHVMHVVHTRDMDTGQTRYLCQLKAVAANTGGGEAPNTVKLGAILALAAPLVGGFGVYSGSGLIFGESFVEGGEGPIFDPRDPQNHSQVIRFVVRVRKS